MEKIHEKIEELYQSVHEATKPIHNDPPGRKGYFRPTLKRLHHLHPNGSKMERNPLAILGTSIYKGWERLRDWIKGFFKRMHPKDPDVIYGTRHHGHVVGRITFSEREDHDVPIHHLLVELWGRKRFGRWYKLGESFTGPEGAFSIPYDLDAVHGLGLKGQLVLEILHSEGMQFDAGGKSTHIYELFEARKIPRVALVGLRYNVGLIQLHYWEYRTDTPLPRVQITDIDKNPPQKWSQARMDAISLQFIPVELISLRIKEKLLLNPDALTLDEIQSYYPVNMTHGMDDESPDIRISRTDAYFGFRMMNGVYANIFDLWPDDPDTYWLHYHWSSYDHEDHTYIFPDVTCKFRMNDDGYLMPTEIILKGALKKGEPPNTRHVLRPDDGGHWAAAKRIARVQAALSAQVDKHFIGTHANVEQYAIAIHRNLQRNPIAAIYHPHLRGITLVNHMADKTLLGADGYIVRTSALTPKGLADRSLDTLGTHDWKNYRPTRPISDKHSYAIVSNLFWDILDQFVTEYMDDHREGIIAEWHEVYAMSQDLVKHSVPVFLCNYLSGHQQTEGINLGDWFTKTGRMDLAADRVMENGVPKAVSPITASPQFDPDGDDWENLKQASIYLIYQATLGHFWSNFQQYDDIGELKYSTLGLRYGDGPDGALGPEDDESIAPDKKICVETMWWANMLSRTGYGFIMKNEDNDIHPRLIELIKENEGKFEAYHFDIYDLQSRTNI